METKKKTRRNFIKSFVGKTFCISVINGMGCILPDNSPVRRGRFKTGRKTIRLPLPEYFNAYTTGGITCPDGHEYLNTINDSISVLYYYPSTMDGTEISNELQTYPVLLYAHAHRDYLCPNTLPNDFAPELNDITQDYTRIHSMLDHVCSWGCIIFIPDLSAIAHAPEARAEILYKLYEFLLVKNYEFSYKLSLLQFMLAGHSTGATGSLIAREMFSRSLYAKPMATALIAPAVDNYHLRFAHVNIPSPLLILKGTKDSVVLDEPNYVYNSASGPKALVSIEGANHFGYTEICNPSNRSPYFIDSQGELPRISQALSGAAFLVVLFRRFCFDDQDYTPYLTGRPLEANPLGLRGRVILNRGM